MSAIFISYRREDSQNATGRIHDHLDMYFGPDATFRDIDSIEGGTNFRQELDIALGHCLVVLAIIGPRWLTTQNHNGRRLLDPTDLVRIELSTALARKVAVIPVLVSFASMPERDQLPRELAALTNIQSVTVPPNRAFARGMRELVDRVHAVTGLPFDDYPILLRDSRSVGLVAIKNSFVEERTIVTEIVDSRDLMVVMNDGRSWINSNREVLGRRVADGASKTKVVLLHPKSEFIGVLVKKNKKTRVQQIEEIRRSFDVLRAAAANLGNLEIRGHHGFNPFTLILTDRYAFVSPYLFNERGSLPLLKFSSQVSSGLYQDIREDALKLFDQATSLTEADFS